MPPGERLALTLCFLATSVVTLRGLQWIFLIKEEIRITQEQGTWTIIIRTTPRGGKHK